MNRISIVLTVCATAAIVSTARGENLLIVQVGDSYASGEGTPDISATGCRIPPAILGSMPPLTVPCATTAVWSANAGTALASSDRLCHRSARAGGRLAADALRGLISGANVTVGGAPLGVEFVSLACTGARIENLIDHNQSGFRPQLLQVKEMFGDRTIDVLLMSIGGNDAGFGKMIVRCIRNPSCESGSDVTDTNGVFNPDRVGERVALEYDRLRAFIDEQLPNVRRVLIVEYPNPMFDDSGNLCANAPIGDWLAQVDREEANWAATTVVPKLNTIVRQAAERSGWTFVSGTVAAFAGHGYCANGRFLNTFRDALSVMGGLPELGGDPLEGDYGAVHPNRAGHLAYRDIILTALSNAVPLSAPILALQDRNQAGARTEAFPTTIRLAWDRQGFSAGGFQVAVRGAAAGGPLESPPPAIASLPFRFGETPDLPFDGTGGWTFIRKVNSTTFNYPLTGIADFAVRACSEFLCSAWSEPVRISNVPLTAPIALTRDGPSGTTRVRWQGRDVTSLNRFQIAYRPSYLDLWTTRWLEPGALRFDLSPAPAPNASPTTVPAIAVGDRVAPRAEARITPLAPTYEVFARQCGPSFDSPRFRGVIQCGPWSTGLRLSPGAPATPAIKIVDAAGSSIELMSAPPSHGKPPAMILQLSVAVIGPGVTPVVRSYNYPTVSANTRQYQVGSRSPAVSARACNDAGCSEWSKAVNLLGRAAPSRAQNNSPPQPVIPEEMLRASPTPPPWLQ